MGNLQKAKVEKVATYIRAATGHSQKRIPQLDQGYASAKSFTRAAQKIYFKQWAYSATARVLF
jgi:hypothetical protein